MTRRERVREIFETAGITPPPVVRRFLEGELVVLAVGIRDDLAALLGDTALGSEVARAMTALNYRKRVAQGGPRYDLDGNVRGEVTEEQRAQAIAALERRRQRRRNRKIDAQLQQAAAERKAREAAAEAERRERMRAALLCTRSASREL